MLVLRCPTHPTYKAIRKPKVKCDDCEKLYEKSELEEEIEELRHAGHVHYPYCDEFGCVS